MSYAKRLCVALPEICGLRAGFHRRELAFEHQHKSAAANLASGQTARYVHMGDACIHLLWTKPGCTVTVRKDAVLEQSAVGW